MPAALPPATIFSDRAAIVSSTLGCLVCPGTPNATERSRGTEENHVNPIRADDLVGPVDAGAGLDLHDHDRGLVGRGNVVR